MDKPLSTGGTYRNAAIVVLALLFGTCSQTERMATQPPVASPSPAAVDRRTASGPRFDIQALTAAHRSLPFGTEVLGENLANGRRIELRIADRGPYVRGRIIDLSPAAARRLRLKQQGVGLVGVTILPPTSPNLIASGR
jgi:rare lipoprotein A